MPRDGWFPATDGFGAARWLVPPLAPGEHSVEESGSSSVAGGAIRAIQPNDLLLVWLRPELAIRVARAVPDDPDEEPFHPDVLEAWFAQADVPAPPRGFAYFVTGPPGWTDFEAWHAELNACIATTEDLAPPRTLAVMTALLFRGRPG